MRRVPDPIEDTLNELTFAARLTAATAVRTQRKKEAEEPTLIARADIEEKQIGADGRVRRCDVRLSSPSGRKLASGELKRPEVPEGRDPRNEKLRNDARRKAIARGLPYYFTCNMAEVVLYSVAASASEDDIEVASFALAPITRSVQADAYQDQIARAWEGFLDDLEMRLVAAGRTRPTVTTEDVIAIRDAIYDVAAEALNRVIRRVRENPELADELRAEASQSFDFPAALNDRFPDKFREELVQILRFGVFVVTQKLVLYRVLEDSGPRRAERFALDPLEVPSTSTDPRAILALLDSAFSLAMSRSRDYETAFLPRPLVDVVFSEPHGQSEVNDCRVGEVWNGLLTSIKNVSWVSISQNIVGLLYEIIVDPQFRHHLGQFYTPEDVVDLLATFAIRKPGDVVMDPASGGGSFLCAVYHRKRALGELHEDVLSSIWGFEITAFAAELSTVTLATTDTREPAAYPRVLLTDFFEIRPGLLTELELPGHSTRLRVPEHFDAVVGNPPYISYRRLLPHTQRAIVNALARASSHILLPKFSGKSDAYVWFIVHATQFLRDEGRLAFVVSSAILFSDYGIPLIRFIGHNYKICAVIESMVERWFPDADTNAVLLLLERESDEQARAESVIRFVRLRRPLAQLLPSPETAERRGALEELLEEILSASPSDDDPRMQVNLQIQGADGGLSFAQGNGEEETLLSEEDEG